MSLVEAMDLESNKSGGRRSGSLGRTSSAGSSLRRRSLSLSGAAPPQIDDDVESESVSQAGDIGDRALHSQRYSDSGSLRFSVDNVIENGVVVPIQEDALLHPHGFWSRDPTVSNIVSPIPPLPSDIIFPLSTDPIVYSANKNQVGSFLMGWWGVVFKGDISSVSDHLAIGLTTGYLGSLTTFSGWNQKMLDLSVDGQWVSSVLGFLIGLFLVAYSIIFGVETAKGFRWLLQRLNTSSRSCIRSSSSDWRVDSFKRHLAVLVVLVLLLGLLWGVSGTLERRDFESGGSGAQLWLACMVGPLGVWIRWFLARFNGRGLGGVNTKTCDTVATGIQFGLLGCLSTVSTFIAEFNAMRQSKHPWRAYAYATITIVVSFGLGTLIYSVPVWTKGYN
ncbi:hypothetical protein L1049_025447 [Liquidambar formosana]|uniref:Uncharacterized protein n=1 Tax=Liquidambar formosana TaxID=63359 RepID=A0AAP0NEM8_LIQFO